MLKIITDDHSFPIRYCYAVGTLRAHNVWVMGLISAVGLVTGSPMGPTEKIEGPFNGSETW